MRIKSKTRKTARRFAACALALCLPLPVLAGCSDRRELDTLGIVLGVAIDKAKEPGEIELTVQMANIGGGQSTGTKSKSKVSKSESSGGGAKPYLNVTGTGHNVNYILREMQHEMSRKIYVPHNQALIFGEEQARAGIRDTLDFFARAAEARMTHIVFVAEGKGKDILDTEPDFEQIPATELAKTVKDQKLTSHAPIVTEFEFVNAMISKTTAPVAPLVRIEDSEGVQRTVIDGSAVFKESVMVGKLNGKETRGLLFVKNKVKLGIFQLDVMGTTTSTEIRNAKCRVTPELFTDGTVVMHVSEEVTEGLGDQSGTVNLSDPDNIPAVLSAVEKAVRDEIQSAVDKSKELNADIFGFGEYLNAKYPDEWKQMKSKWDEIYKNIRVDIRVKASANGNGRLSHPLDPM